MSLIGGAGADDDHVWDAVADKYPSAIVDGIDFTPIQPVWIPANLRFIVDDIEHDWQIGTGFDFIHLRQIFPVLHDPNKVLRQSFEYVCFFSSQRGPAIKSWSNWHSI